MPVRARASLVRNKPMFLVWGSEDFDTAPTFSQTCQLDDKISCADLRTASSAAFKHSERSTLADARCIALTTHIRTNPREAIWLLTITRYGRCIRTLVPAREGEGESQGGFEGYP